MESLKRGAGKSSVKAIKKFSGFFLTPVGFARLMRACHAVFNLFSRYQWRLAWWGLVDLPKGFRCVIFSSLPRPCKVEELHRG